MIQNLSIAIKAPTVKLNKQVLQKLVHAYETRQTRKWKVLPDGTEFRQMKAPSSMGTYFGIIVYDKKVIGYVLVQKVVVPSKPKLRCWMVVQSYLVPEIRGVGIMNKLYSLIIDSGRLVASPTMTQAARSMWISRIKTDQRRIYAVWDTQNSFVHVDSRLISLMKNSIFDGSAKTFLLAFQKNDPSLKRLHFLDK